MQTPKMLLCLFVILSTLAASAEPATDAVPRAGMNNERIAALLEKLELAPEGAPGRWRFTLGGREVTLLTHEAADRMRILTPVVRAEDLDQAQLARVLQANFDSALDARYAIAQGILWSAFIHPLAGLDDAALVHGLGQVVNLANTYGEGYTSGVLLFGGGDSRGIRERELLDALIEKGLAI